MANNQMQLTADEQKQLEEAQLKGEQLGMLIAALPITDETREALLQSLSNYSPEQLEKLHETLLAMQLHARTSYVDKELIDAVAKINVSYNNAVKLSADKAMNSFDQIARQAGL